MSDEPMRGGPARVERVRVKGPRSSRRRTAALRARRRWRIRTSLVVASVAAVPVLVVGALLVRDGLAVRAALVVAQDELDVARAALVAGDLGAAADAVAVADAALAPAYAATDGPLWRAVARVPLAGRPVDLTARIVDVAWWGTQVARIGLDSGGQRLRAGIDLRVAGGAIDLVALQDTADLLAGLPLTELSDAVVGLRGADARLAPAEVRAARSRLLALADEELGRLTGLADLLDVLPAFLGADERRDVLVVVQTSAELRGTGGLFGPYTVLTLDEGRMSIGPVGAYEPEAEQQLDLPAISDLGGLSGPSEVAIALPDDFAARYGHVGADRTFSNVNVDPDLPTTGALVLDLVEARTGRRLDGVVLLDPVGLGALLTALDVTLTVPEDLRAGTEAPATVTGPWFARFATQELYEHFGDGRETQRTRLVAALGDQAFRAVFERDWDAEVLVRAVADASLGRHLQVHATRPAEAAAFARLPVGGAFADALADPRVDLTAVTANNAVGGKQDVRLGHRFAARIALGRPGAAFDEPDGTVVHPTPRAQSLAITLVNPLPRIGLDRYVLGNCLVGGETWGCFEGPDGDNRTWWSVWMDVDEDVTAVRGPVGLLVGRSSLHGAQVLDPYVEVRSQSSETITIASRGQALLVEREGALEYTWAWWRQAKAISDVVDVVIIAPPGWRVETATLTGGAGRLDLLGEDAGAAPAALTVEDARVRLTGAIGRDTRVVVRLVPR
jgi:hypothetical protein